MVASFLVLKGRITNQSEQNMQQTTIVPVGANNNVPLVQPVKYCLYARKSTESDEKQALSIDSQVKEMMRIAEREALEVIDIRRESHSAKDSGQRLIFSEILKDIRIGRYNERSKTFSSNSWTGTGLGRPRPVTENSFKNRRLGLAR